MDRDGKPLNKSSPRSQRPPLARYVLIGIVLLAMAAIAVAWADETGVTKPILKALNSSRY